MNSVQSLFGTGAETISVTGEIEYVRPAFYTDRGVLYQVDCLSLLGALNSESLDCVFADPPFNIGKDYGNGKESDLLASDQYLSWCFRWLDECVRVLRKGAAMFVYILPQWGFHFAAHLEQRGLLFRHWIAVSMKGTFPRGRKLYPAHYALLYFSKGQPKTFNRLRVPIPACRHCGKDIKDYGGHRKYLNPLGLNLTDIWEDTAPARHQKFKARWHVNELKPLIPARCIELATNPDEVILDPFGGGGSTYEAAQRLNRFWIGSEILDCGPIQQRFDRNLPGVKEKLPSKLRSLFACSNSHLGIGVKRTCQKS